jgi:branched-chain amino acid transport system substrate-binding protein
MKLHRTWLVAGILVAAALAADPAAAEKKYGPGVTDTEIKIGNIMPYSGPASAYGYGAAQTLVHVLQQCGDDLTRENVMKQAANLKDFQLDMLLPGIAINTSPTDFAPIEQMQMQRFTGERWELFGPVMNGTGGS